MNIEPRIGILHIKRHKNTAVKVDMAIDESDEDKSLITAEVIKGQSEAGKDYAGLTVIVGKYATFGTTIQGEKHYFVLEQDVIATCDYKE